MRNASVVLLLIGVAMLSASVGVSAADKLCADAAMPLANREFVLAPLPLVNLPGGQALPVPLVDPLGGVLRSLVQGRAAEPLKQVPIDDALNEARNLDPALKFSPAEQKRQQNSKACRVAYANLVSTFLPLRQSFGLGGLPADVALTQFVGWWLAPERTAADRVTAMPVLNAQRAFDSACLSRDIPAEIDADAIRATVGLLVFNDLPVCVAFRINQSSILTARHCFVQGSGELTQMAKALSETGTSARLWFQYEAEINNRFEVCRASLPKVDEVELHPERDRIKMAIAATDAPIPAWEWADAKPGQSLYVRVYFPFGSEVSFLERLRGSSSGGCAALVVKGKCVLNGCQSLPLTSGAPVFVRPDPGDTSAPLKVVGLHLGSSSYGNTVAPSACPNLKPSDLPSGNFAFQFREN